MMKLENRCGSTKVNSEFTRTTGHICDSHIMISACAHTPARSSAGCCKNKKSKRVGPDFRHSFSHLHLRPVVLALTLAALFGASWGAHIISNDINAAVVDVASSSTNEEPVAVNWGVADTSAAVGKVFNFHIPREAFQGNVHSLKIKQVGKEELPKWLSYDETSQALRGVPSASDKGAHSLEVIAHDTNNVAQAKDVFSIFVKDDQHHISSTKPLKSMGKSAAKPVNCQSGEPITMVTIVVDTDLDQLAPQDRVALVNKLTSHLNIGAEMLKMAPVGDKPKFDSSALVAGPGDSKSSKFSGAFVSWLVGCGKVETDHMPILQKVETSSANGDMSNAIGHSIVGWHVTNSRLQPSVKRVRRQIRATATPGITMAPPTKLPAATVTATDKAGETDMTRTVPSMVSPTFTMDEIQPTSTQPTHSKPADKVVPTRRLRPKSSSADIQPTKVVDMEATRGIMQTDEPKIMSITPTGVYTDGSPMTRSEVLEPSIPIPEPEMTRKTETLPVTKEMTAEPTGETRPSTGATRLPPMVTTSRTTPSMRPTSRRTHRPTIPKPLHPFNCPEDGVDRNPEVWETIKDIEIMPGELLRFKIPEKAFFDCEQGNTRDLRIDLFDDERTPVADAITWLRFDQRKQVMVGLPMKEDARMYKLLVVGIDSKGAAVRQKFALNVLSAMDAGSAPNHEFAMTIDYDYDQFMGDPKHRIDMTNKIARLYGDKNSKKMTVIRIGRGSVIYSWTNNSLPSDGGCPVEDIVKLMGKFMNKDMTLTDEAKRSMEPYVISKGAAVPSGSCSNQNFTAAFLSSDYDSTAEPMPPPYQTLRPVTGGKPSDVTTAGVGPANPSKDGDSDDDIWITTVVPAVVIVAILLIALLIACILYRKKRKGKMDMQDHHTFVNKGIPVIFADELEDKPSDSSKPLIMQEEKPPNPPPEYHRSSSESPGSTPPSNHKDPHAATTEEEQDLEETDVNSPLYRPPPPVTASSENKQPRPHVQPAYRNPPPYVPP